MRIVQIMPEFGLAGAETMCENLTYELIKLGHNVTVVSMYDYHSAITERLEKSGVDVRYLGKKSGFDFSMISKIKKVLISTKADAVHTHRYCAQYAAPAAILAGVKHRVHTVHNIASKENLRAARKLNNFFFRHCAVIPVALSPEIQRTVIDEYGISYKQVPIIFNGIDLSKCMVKTDYGINGKFKILHIGRFSEQKNHIGLLKAFEQFNKENPDSVLQLIGDGELKPEIEKYVLEHKLSDCVEFLGVRSDIYPFLQKADMFILPSNYEGIPMTLIEAMGSAVPIVAAAVGGVCDMLDNESALLVSGNTEEISNAIKELYLDADLRKSLGKAAFKKSKLFSSEIMAKKYLNVYAGEANGL